MKFENWAKIIVLFGLMAAGGCEVPAQLFWSPDGTKAVYWNSGRHCVIDEQGVVVQPFTDTSAGGFAWAADSSVLYHAVSKPIHEGPAPFQTDDRWLEQRIPDPPAMEKPNNESKEMPYDMTVCSFQDGQSTELFYLRDRGIFYMILSPEQNWLAVVAQRKDHDKTFELYVYSIPTKTLYPLAMSSGLGICFSGPSRLAYLSPSRPDANLDSLMGTLVEVKLDELSDGLERETLANIAPAMTAWLQAVGDDILLTAVPMTLPGKPADDKVFNLYYMSRADGAITSIAEGVGPLFMPSPDGKRILFEKKTPLAERDIKSELAIMNSNGSDVHVLRDVTVSGFPMWPAWRGDSEIAFVVPPSEAKDKTKGKKTSTIFDVVLYQISPAHELEPVRILSQTWDDDMKPSRNGNQGWTPATQPATDAIQ